MWIYYDWASGADVPGNGYHHLFPLAHKYLGFMDLFGRRNIQDVNLRLTLQPRENVKVLLWYHVLQLASGNDVPYSVAMTPLNGGRAFYTTNEALGDYVLVDFLEHRRRLTHRRAG